MTSGTVDVSPFNREAVIAALRTDQAGNSIFPEFVAVSWRAGVVRYDVDFRARTVSYYGSNGEEYVEKYPAVEEDTMRRERALKILWVLVGLLFTAGVYPLIESLLHPADLDSGDTMMLSLYVALGIFLLIAVRNPSAHRSLIAFAAWSSFAHAVAVSILGFEIPSQRGGFLVGSAVLVVIGVALLALAPAKQSGERVSATVA